MTRIDSQNHAGWEVQMFFGADVGWERVCWSDTYTTEEEAKQIANKYLQGGPIEYRCYEALHMKEQA